jgi:hypothetical protein
MTHIAPYVEKEWMDGLKNGFKTLFDEVSEEEAQLNAAKDEDW